MSHRRFRVKPAESGRRPLHIIVFAGALLLAGCEGPRVTSETPGVQSAADDGATPDRVADLAATAFTDTSATLTWTQVDDGTGEPAKYDVRYALSPIGYGWGEATVVAEGSCATPVQGTAVDSTLTCAVMGLDASTAYDFQLVAFRGELNDGAVFGDLSNVATDTTEDPPGPPGRVTDLAVRSVSDTSATLAFTEVDDGAGDPADYDARYALSPIGYGWGEATTITEGSCATPVEGTEIGAARTCTVEGLDPSTAYDFQLVAFRGTLNEDAVFGDLSNVATDTTLEEGSTAAQECASAESAWIWCDDFEQDRLASYFEHDSSGGDFVRAAGVGIDGSHGMRARWSEAGQVSAGFLHLAFGKTPQDYFEPVDAGTEIHRDVYWRMYVRNEPDWTGGGGDKLSRAMSFASTTSWAQAMIAHVWSGSSPDEEYLVLDPASGTDEEGNLLTTEYNDFDNLRWLGAVRGATPLFNAEHVGQWHCVEAHARLNDAGLANGVFELWIDDELDARETGLNWVGSFDDYGINAVYFENHWNEGAPQPQERYLDNIVVSTERIGCDGSTPPPSEPEIEQLVVEPSADTLNALGSSLQLSVTAYDTNGETVSDPSIDWSSLDSSIATVDGTGTVTSEATGVADIVATAACCTAADTAPIRVRQVVASVSVTPSTDTLAIGQTVQLSATALDSAGSPVPGRTAAWASSNTIVATVDGSGLVTALELGTSSISATIDGATGWAEITVADLIDEDGDRPNEPTDFVSVAEHDFEATPLAGPPGACTSLGILDGCWFEYDGAGNLFAISDLGAPVSAPGVLRVRFPDGMAAGSSPGMFQGWATGSETNSTQYEAVYESGRIRVPTSDFEMHAVGVKLLGYLGVGEAGQGRPPSQIYFFSDNPGYPETTPQEATTIAIVQQDVGDRKMRQNVVTDPVFTFGEWHHYEYVMRLNDIGAANGTIRMWWNGELILDYDDVEFRDADDPSGFYGRRWDPIWGGSSGYASRSRDDHLDIDHLYISGVPF